MFASENKEIKEMLETLLKKEIERKINKGEEDTRTHNGQTIIQIDHGLNTYVLLYLLLGQNLTTVSDGSVDTVEHSNLTVETKLQKMSKEITQMQEKNTEFYLEVLEKLR